MELNVTDFVRVYNFRRTVLLFVDLYGLFGDDHTRGGRIRHGTDNDTRTRPHVSHNETNFMLQLAIKSASFSQCRTGGVLGAVPSAAVMGARIIFYQGEIQQKS